MTPAAKPARTNDQSGQDGSLTSQTTVPENPKNDHEAANQTAEPDCKFTATSGFGPLNLSLSYQERSQNTRQTPLFVE
ncbi:hypothetical protein DSO57_1003306 [Entomophthora muscae]|uniref:Uncharacterized protein n=1 Tax=Entomophthora muscae TaxID=34485 RepID=A0ACC2T895_9FUNG|nr:hypothetical protein DSO57_1003306 [Entomophthora muscae]